MPRTNPAAESWGAFIRTHFAKLRMNQAEFRRRMDAEGYDISKQTASQWFNGENAPDANKVLTVASILDASDADALRAAGYAPVAERIERGSAENAGEDRAAAREAVDPIIEDIMGMTHLGLKVRQALISQYLAEQEEADLRRESERKRARQRARDLARALPAEGDNGGAGNAA